MSTVKTIALAVFAAIYCCSTAAAVVPANADDSANVLSSTGLPEGTVVTQSTADGDWFLATAPDGHIVLGFYDGPAITDFVVQVDQLPVALSRCGDVGVPRDVGLDLGGCAPTLGRVTIPFADGPSARPTHFGIGKHTEISHLKWTGWGSGAARATGIIDYRTKTAHDRRIVHVTADQRGECGEAGGTLTTAYLRLRIRYAVRIHGSVGDTTSDAKFDCY